MAGTINSLGLGSGVLTADLIDKLKSNDQTLMIKPFDSKIALNQQKAQALDLLNSLLTAFKSNVSALDSDTLYQKRTVSGNNDYASVTAASGSQIRNFSLEVTNTAKKNVLQSGSFSATTAPVATGTGAFNLSVAGVNYKIDYTSSTSLTDLKDNINNIAGKAVSASILQTATNQYSLVITSKETGKNQTISLTDMSAGNFLNNNLESAGIATGSFLAKDYLLANATGDTGNIAVNVDGVDYNFAYTDTTRLTDLVDSINNGTVVNQNGTALSQKVTAQIVEFGTNDYRMVLTPKNGVSPTITITDTPDPGTTGVLSQLTTVSNTNGSMNIIQNAEDAIFKFDGISMTRTKNEITDIASGLTVNLLKEGGSANIGITQNRDQISTEMEGLANSYNTLQKQLKSMLAVDKEAGTVGIFNGDNTIRGISREITRFITSVDSNGYSLANYGIDLDRDGVMSFNKSTFMEKMNADPEGTEKFFSGKTTITHIGTTSTSSFASASTLISSGASGTMKITIGGIGHNLAYDSTTTLQQMADLINADSTLFSKVTASVVESSTNNFRMVLTPKDNAIGESISISDSIGGGLLSAMTTTTTSNNVLSTTDGIFTSLNNVMKRYIGAEGLFTNLTEENKTQAKSLSDERAKAVKLLEARYATLTSKFAAYDSMISKINSQFSALQQQIQMAVNAKQ